MERYREPGSLAAFCDVFNDIDAMYNRFAQGCGVAPTEYWVLVSMSEGLTSQRDICAMLALNRQTVNSAVRGLVRQGLIRVEPTPGDARTKALAFTEAGRAFVNADVRAMHRLEEQVWHRLEERERIQLTELLGRYRSCMREALEERGLAV